MISTLQPLFAQTRLQALVIALCALALYGQTYRFDYTLDDGEAVVRQPNVVKGIAGIPAILSSPSVFTGSFDSAGEGFAAQESDGRSTPRRSAYRPIAPISFAMEYEAAGNNAVLRHAVNAILYAAVSVMAFFAARRLLRNIHEALPFFASLLFVAHPLHAEVVCNIKSRDEIFALLFGLGAFLSALRYASEGGARRLAASCGLFFLALLSKESAVTLLPLFPLGAWLLYGRSNEGNQAAHKQAKSAQAKSAQATATPAFGRLLTALAIGTTLTAGVWLALSLSIADWRADDVGFSSPLNNLYAAASAAEIIPTKILVCGMYLAQLAFPLTLSFDYGYRHIEPTAWDWRVALAALALAATVAHALWYIVSPRAEDNRPAFGLIWLVCAASIASNFFVYSGAAMADRFMFAPSFGWAVALTSGAAWVAGKLRLRRQSFVFTALTLAALFYGARTLARVPDWENPYELARAAARDTPNSIKARLAFALESSLRFKSQENAAQRDSEARARYLRDMYENASALTGLAPAMAHGYYTLALYFERYAPEADTPRKDSARAYYLETLTRAPNNPEYLHDWAMFRGHEALAEATLERADLFDSALARYREALGYNPSSFIAVANIGSVYARAGRFGEALPYLQRAVALNPYDAEIRERLHRCSVQEAVERGNAALATGNAAGALAAYRAALPFGALRDIVWLNIALAHIREGKRAEAVRALEEAVRENPQNPHIEGVRRLVEAMR
jgi:tetratricopeptide (TPR) repeat protein